MEDKEWWNLGNRKDDLAIFMPHTRKDFVYILRDSYGEFRQ